MKEDVLAFLSKERLCVVSSINAETKPQAALVGFTFGTSLDLLIGTSNQTRKYQNLTAHPEVAVVIGFSGDANVQLEGTARLIDKTELPTLLERGFKQLPGKDKYRQDPTEAWFVITPNWLRLTVHGEADRVEEMRQFA